MSVAFAGGVVSGYIAAVVGIHRFNVWRMRRQAEGFVALERLDWDALLSGLLPDPPRDSKPELLLEDGSPAPLRLSHGDEKKRSLLRELIVGTSKAPLTDLQLAEAGISGGEATWVRNLWAARHTPHKALAWLEQAKVESAAEVYLREHLTLNLRATVFNREWVSYEVTRRLNEGIARFGDVAALYFVRARAKALVGLNRRAIDDLARAVYFSRQAPFYLSAVLDTPYLQEARPPLVFQCRQALDEREADASNVALRG
ncbi:MAG: hypothetical protein ACJ790_11645 [Myxococcaceae bacterium]